MPPGACSSKDRLWVALLAAASISQAQHQLENGCEPCCHCRQDIEMEMDRFTQQRDELAKARALAL